MGRRIEMSENIRLQPRDKEILERIIDFNGLNAAAIINVFFDSQKYGYRRIKQLQNNGYLKQIYYYAQNKKKGQVFSQRIAAIYYATPKALREVGISIDPRFVVPNKEKLDVTNLIGNLFARIPKLISKRQAKEIYGLKNFMPISCVVPLDNPIFLYILGNKVGRQDVGRIVGFIKSDIFPNARHFIISRTFRKKLLLTNSYFIPWTFALEYLQNIVNDNYFYLNKFLEIVEEQFPGIQFLTQPEPLIKAKYQNKILHIGELFSGSNHLRLVLQDPPENTYIYVPSRRHFYGVSLKQGSFLFYSKQDKETFEMLLRDKNMYSVPYKR